MSVLDGEDIVYVARVPTARIMAVSINVGTRFPAYATSMGRVLLSRPARRRARGLPRAGRAAPLSPRTLTSRERLRAELAKVRSQGWALVDQELEEGLRSIAAPIRDRNGRTIAAVNLSAHASRMSIDAWPPQARPGAAGDRRADRGRPARRAGRPPAKIYARMTRSSPSPGRFRRPGPRRSRPAGASAARRGTHRGRDDRDRAARAEPAHARREPAAAAHPRARRPRPVRVRGRAADHAAGARASAPSRRSRRG